MQHPPESHVADAQHGSPGPPHAAQMPPPPPPPRHTPPVAQAPPGQHAPPSAPHAVPPDELPDEPPEPPLDELEAPSAPPSWFGTPENAPLPPPQAHTARHDRPIHATCLLKPMVSSVTVRPVSTMESPEPGDIRQESREIAPGWGREGRRTHTGADD